MPHSSAALAIFVALLTLATRRDVGFAQEPTFRSTVQTVAVYATVHGDDGRLVPDLDQSAFQVLDNGKPADITVFSNEIQPITAVVLLDTSGSMTPLFDRLKPAVSAFIAALLPHDRLRIGTFGLEIALSPHLTADRALLARVVNEEVWMRGGDSPVWSAMRAAMDSLAGEGGRRVILLVSDGMNSGGSLAGWPAGYERTATSQAVEQEFMVYAIGFETSRSPLLSDFGSRQPIETLDRSVKNLATRTGGGYFTVPVNADPYGSFAEVAEELRHQYAVGFAPAVLDGKTHKIEVRMTRRGLTARARQSYIATPRS